MGLIELAYLIIPVLFTNLLLFLLDGFWQKWYVRHKTKIIQISIILVLLFLYLGNPIALYFIWIHGLCIGFKLRDQAYHE